MDRQPFFSVITITYNAEKKIRHTIETVFTQSCKDYEYILIDGASTDSTGDIIESYKGEFEKNKIDYRFISEKDNGIYDAMNKGIRMARGKWIGFMNAGDYYWDKMVLEKVKLFAQNNDNTDVIYGDTMVYKSNGLTRLEKARPIDSIIDDIPFCHQSSFVKNVLMTEHPFNLKYRIGADYDFFVFCYMNNKSFRYFQEIISIYEFEGLSMCETSEIDLLRERIESRRQRNLISEEQYYKEIEALRKYRLRKEIKRIIKRVMPSLLLEKRLYKKNIRDGWNTELKI